MTDFLRWLRASYRERRELWLGVGGVVVIVVLLVGSGQYHRLGWGRQQVVAEFAQAAGVKVGDPVDVSGVPVGRVSRARLEGDHVLLTLAVDTGVRLGRDARASIKMATLLGARYIDLSPGAGSGLPGRRIPLRNTTVPYDLNDVVQRGTTTVQKLDTGQLLRSLQVIGDQLGDSPQLTATALDSVGALAKTIADRRDQVDRLLKDLDAVTGVLSQDRNSLMLVVTQGEAIASQVMARQALLRQLLDNVAAVTKQLQQIGAENNGQFGPTLAQLDVISKGLRSNAANLDRLLQIMPVSLRQFNNAFANGPYGEVGLPWLFPDNWLCAANVVAGCRR